MSHLTFDNEQTYSMWRKKPRLKRKFYMEDHTFGKNISYEMK